MIKKIIIFFLFFSLYFSCEEQCTILEDKIKVCKDNFYKATKGICREDDPVYGNACFETNIAYDLIKDINDALDKGNDNQQNIETACSTAISEIDFDLCDKDNFKQADWEDTKYLMKDFGKRGLIEEKYNTISINYEKYSKEEEETSKNICTGVLYKSYEDVHQISKNIDINFNRLKLTSSEKIDVFRSGDLFFIGQKINESYCDFNNDMRLNIDFCDYDTVFCSKTSGWFESQNNCALNRQEVFLIDFKKDYFTERCVKKCRLIDKSGICTNDVVIFCNEQCKEQYTDEKCEQECLYSKCLDDELFSQCYENNNCQNEFDTCSESCRVLSSPEICKNTEKSFCQEECKYQECKNNCDISCNSENNKLNEFCQYQCYNECTNFGIDEKSRLILFFREVKDSEKSGSNCDTSIIFPKNPDDSTKYLNYCLIEFKID